MYLLNYKMYKFCPRELLFFSISTKAQPWNMAPEQRKCGPFVDVRGLKNHEKLKILISFKIDF